MVEKISQQSHETQLDTEALHEISEKQRESLREKLERAEHEHTERQSEQEIVAEAKKLTKDKENEHPLVSPAERRRGPISKKQLSHSFDTQMTQAQSHMSPVGRIFSKFIHTKPIEAASDFVSSTIARPNALLSGSIAAFAVVTVLYFVAKYYGFTLSGFETIGAFIIGWIIGILYDYFSVMIRGHKS